MVLTVSLGLSSSSTDVRLRELPDAESLLLSPQGVVYGSLSTSLYSALGTGGTLWNVEKSAAGSSDFRLLFFPNLVCKIKVITTSASYNLCQIDTRQLTHNKTGTLTNSEDPAAFHQGLHCL